MRISDFLNQGKPKPPAAKPTTTESRQQPVRPALASSKPVAPKQRRPGDFGIEWRQGAAQQVKDYKAILTESELRAYLQRCKETGYFSFDWETAADEQTRSEWARYEAEYQSRRYTAFQNVEDLQSLGFEPAEEGTPAQRKAEDKRRETAFAKQLKDLQNKVEELDSEYRQRKKDYLKTPLDPHQGEICTISISAAPHESRIVPISHKVGKNFEEGRIESERRELLLSILAELILHDPNVVKIAVNLSFETKYLAKYGRYLTGKVADPLVMWTRLLQVAFPSRIKNVKEPAQGWGLKPATEVVFGVKMSEFQELLDSHGVDFFDEIPVTSGPGLSYSAEDADYGLQHYLHWLPYTHQIPKYYEWLHTVEMPFSRVIGLMEYHGMNWDNSFAEMRRQEAYAAQEHAANEIKRIAKEACGLDVNPGRSGKTAGIKFLLFEHMKLPQGKQTETGAVGLDKEALIDIEFMLKNNLLELSEEQYLAADLPEDWEYIPVPPSQTHQHDPKDYAVFYNLDRDQKKKLEILRREPHPHKEAGLALIEQLRKIQKYTTLLSSHVEGREKHQNPRSRRIHASYSPWTETSRLKSGSPNGQNVPRVYNDMLGVRNMYAAPKGRILFLIDFSGFELRILAWKSGDEVMIDIFANDGDIHRTTAAAIAGKPQEEVTKKERTDAKPANFGIAYGGGPHALQLTIKVDYDQRKTLEECDFMIRGVNRAYPRIQQYQQKTIIQAREDGYVQTAYGYIRLLPEINSPNRYRRQQEERKSINTPIQGTAADFMKRAQNEVYDMIAEGTQFWQRVNGEGPDPDDLAQSDQYPLAHGRTDLIAQIHDEMIFEMDEDPDLVEAAWKAVNAVMSRKPTEDFPVPVLADASVAYRWGEKMPVQEWLDKKREELAHGTK